MKKMEKFIVRNWLWLAAGCILTRKAVEAAYTERGYVAFGGEWLVLPVLLLAVYIVRIVKNEIVEEIGHFEEADTDDRGTLEDHHGMEE